jgi:hypothetical protein
MSGELAVTSTVFSASALGAASEAGARRFGANAVSARKEAK